MARSSKELQVIRDACRTLSCIIMENFRFFPGSSKDPDGILQFLDGKTSVSEATNDVIKYFTATITKWQFLKGFHWL
ncbi:hypothetical protein Tco_0992036 [Tanacetum coccineum]|uniref:Uncharacterized protein n=1 Tax=Tanacetum coccineum TaxID=301880 RepID=A0ABQ5F2M9_9ASTR